VQRCAASFRSIIDDCKFDGAFALPGPSMSEREGASAAKICLLLITPRMRRLVASDARMRKAIAAPMVSLA
jgi:hypothetical protein